MAEYCILTSELRNYTEILHAGDRVLLSGTVYTARDAAHKRIAQLIKNGDETPFDIDGSTVYYAGPTPTPPGSIIGSCGPTTSSRMDKYAPDLYDRGMIASIGKGGRNRQVCDAIIRNKGAYFCAVGGAGALASKCIVKCEVIAFDDLGCESVKLLELKEFPLIVGISCNGENIFDR